MASTVIVSPSPPPAPQFGTPYYMAPEAHPTAKADVFAVGIMACEVAARYLAVEGAPALTLEYSIAMLDRLVADAVGRVEGNYPALARLLVLCTHTSPAARCTSTEALDMVRTAAAAVMERSPGQLGGAGREGPQPPGTYDPCASQLNRTLDRTALDLQATLSRCRFFGCVPWTLVSAT
jgi:serine/threonine protein kinase